MKPVDGPDGPALLDAAIGEHQSNTDVHALTPIFTKRIGPQSGQSYW